MYIFLIKVVFVCFRGSFVSFKCPFTSVSKGLLTFVSKVPFTCFKRPSHVCFKGSFNLFRKASSHLFQNPLQVCIKNLSTYISKVALTTLSWWFITVATVSQAFFFSSHLIFCFATSVISYGEKNFTCGFETLSIRRNALDLLTTARNHLTFSILHTYCNKGEQDERISRL